MCYAMVSFKLVKSNQIDQFTCVESIEGPGISWGPGGACACAAVYPGEQTAGTESLVGSSIP